VTWLRDHWRTVGLIVLAASVAMFGAVLLREVDRNESQDAIDRQRTTQVEAITDQLADVVTQLEEERRVSCAYGNELRRSIRSFVDDLTDNPTVLDKVAIQFADRDCPSIPTPTTVPTEEPAP
jgi:hypothetical protein